MVRATGMVMVIVETMALVTEMEMVMVIILYNV